jgi:hypothetical protein
MGVTRLNRKDRKNKARANNRVAKIKQLLSTPVIKNVDIEELKAGFKQGENPGPNTGDAALQASAPATPAGSQPSAPAAPAAPQAAESSEAPESAEAAPVAPEVAEAPVGTPSKEEVFDAQEAASAQQSADEADVLEPGEVESPGEQFVRNQLADTTTNAQDKDIDAIQRVEEDETDITPTV